MDVHESQVSRDEYGDYHGITLGRAESIARALGCAVEFLLGLFAAGWTEAMVLENYPGLTAESLRAVFGYAADVVAGKPARSTA